MSKTIIYISIILFATNFSFSQESIDFDDAVKKMLINNFDIRIIKKDLELAENNNNLGMAGFLPSVDASSSFSRTFENTESELIDGRIIDGADNRQTNLRAGLQLDWTLFDGFAMFYNYERLDDIEQMNKISVQIEIENRLRELFSVYFDIIRTKENIKILRQNEDFSKERLLRLETAKEFGKATNIEILNATVDYNNDLSNLKKLQVNLNNLFRQLSLLLGENTEKKYNPIESKIEIEQLESIDEYKALMFQRNSSLLLNLKSYNINENDVKLVESAYYPRLSMTSSYTLSEQQSLRSFIVRSESQGFNFTFNANWNLFDGFRTQTERENAIISLEKQELLIQKTRAILDLNLSNNYNNYIELMEIYELEQNNLQNAEANFNRSKELFELGAINSLDLRTAQINYLIANQKVVDLQYDLKIIISEIQLLSGVSLY